MSATTTITTGATSAPVTAHEMPYVGFYVKALHRWFRATDILTAVETFCCLRDENGWGASDIGGRFPLYRMSASGIEKREIGYVSYNGNVKSTEILL